MTAMTTAMKKGLFALLSGIHSCALQMELVVSHPMCICTRSCIYMVRGTAIPPHPRRRGTVFVREASKKDDEHSWSSHTQQRETTDSFTITASPIFETLRRLSSIRYSVCDIDNKSSLDLETKTPLLPEYRKSFQKYDSRRLSGTQSSWFDKAPFLKQFTEEFPISYGCSFTQTVFNGKVIRVYLNRSECNGWSWDFVYTLRIERSRLGKLGGASSFCSGLLLYSFAYETLL